MVEKIGHVKNPLSVIAIFAGIAEISGTIVLPFLHPENQSIYLWFLMLFPSILVLIFFGTLNFNHKSLYAPSDYRDENNFLKSLRYVSFNEKQEKIIAEVTEANEHVEHEDIGFSETADIVNINSNLKNPLEATTLEEPILAYHTSNHQTNETDILHHTSRNQRSSAKAIVDKVLRAQTLSISKLAGELSLDFQTDISYSLDYGRDVMFDAIAIDPNCIHAVEVKFSENGSLGKNSITNVLANAVYISKDLTQKYFKNFTLHFVLVVGKSDINIFEAQERILNEANKFNVNVVVHVYSLSDLTDEFEHLHLKTNTI